jgi:GT2 family glycosyltransferase
VSESLKSLRKYTPANVEVVIYKNNCELSMPADSNYVIFGGIIGDYDGIAVARNKCLRASKGDIIILIDDDILVCKNYITPFLEAFQSDAQIGIVGYDGCILIDEGFLEMAHINPTVIEPHYFDSPYAIRREMLNQIGSYDERLGKYGCDNTDLCLRARKHGWKLQKIINPGIMHFRESTRSIFGRLNPEETESRKSLLRMRKKYPLGWSQKLQLKVEKIL